MLLPANLSNSNNFWNVNSNGNVNNNNNATNANGVAARLLFSLRVTKYKGENDSEGKRRNV
jgi:hypothetical protein